MIPLKLDVFWEQMVDYGVEAKEKRMMFRIRSSNSEFCKSYVYFTSNIENLKVEMGAKNQDEQMESIGHLKHPQKA